MMNGNQYMKAAIATASTLVMALGCDSGSVNPDAAPTETKTAAPAEAKPAEAKPAAAPVLDARTKESIDAYMKAEVANDAFVPIYIGPLGVSVDGAPGLRFDPETMRPRAEDKKGGARSLYIDALQPALEAASKARPVPAERVGSYLTIAPGAFVEADVPFRSVTEVLYTSGQDLRPTGEGDRYVVMSAGGSPLKLMIRRADGAWDGFNATTPGLAVGPVDEDVEPSNNLGVAVSARGIDVAFRGEVLPPIEGCDAAGPTICNEGGVDATELVSKVNMSSGAARQAALAELVAVYDLSGLYNQLLVLKALDPDDTLVTASSAAELPVAVYAAILGAVRSRRASPNADGTFDDDASFGAAGAKPERPNHRGDELFPDVLVALVL